MTNEPTDEQLLEEYNKEIHGQYAKQGEMTKSYISCYNMPNKELEHFEVPDPVYIYIRQLENGIKYGSGGVKRLYPFRFAEKND
jgi:hypothetical protein